MKASNFLSEIDNEKTDIYRELMGQISIGSQASLEQLYDLTVERVYAMAYFILQNTADADEVTCDVYSKTWKKAFLFDPARGSAMAWLLTQCRSISIDLLRKQRRYQEKLHHFNQKNADKRDTDNNPYDILNLIRSGSSVHYALNTLSQPQIYVLYLYYFRGHTLEEIAQLLEIPLGTTKSHVRRALTALKKQLEPEIYDDCAKT